MSPSNRNRFTSFCPIWLLLISFSWLTVLALASSIIFNNSDESRHPCSFWLLLPDKYGSLLPCLTPPTPLWWGNWSATCDCQVEVHPLLLTPPWWGKWRANFHRHIIFQPCWHVGWWCSVFLGIWFRQDSIVKSLVLRQRCLFTVLWIFLGLFFFFWICAWQLQAVPVPHPFYM